VPSVQIPECRVARDRYIVKYFIISLSNRMNQKELSPASLCRCAFPWNADSKVGLDGDVHGAGAEGAHEEPGKAAGATDGEELEVVAGGNVQIEGLPIPGIVDAQLMPAGSNWNRYGVTVHEFRDAQAIEFHDNLAELDIFGRGTTDGDLRPWGWC
jgi:hypothetical protein